MERQHAQRILLIEDCEVIRIGTAMTLEKKYNCIVNTASNAKEAQKLLEQERLFRKEINEVYSFSQILTECLYTLVLLDLGLPGMDGIKLSKEYIRKHYSTRQLPIVAITTSSDSKIKGQCQEAGIQGFFTKPIDYKNWDDILKFGKHTSIPSSSFIHNNISYNIH